MINNYKAKNDKKLMEEMRTPLYVEIFKSSVNNRTSE